MSKRQRIFEDRTYTYDDAPHERGAVPLGRGGDGSVPGYRGVDRLGGPQCDAGGWAMSTDRVPTDALARRLDELSHAVTQGGEVVAREFTMRVPAEPTRDADLALVESAARLRELEEAVEEMKAERDKEFEHSEFMERLFAARHGRGWKHLSLADAAAALVDELQVKSERDALHAEVARLTAQLEGQQAECADWKEIAKASPSVASLVRYKDVMSEIARLRASEATWQETARVRGEALEAVEWRAARGARSDDGFCPWCRRQRYQGHAPDCGRQSALGLAK